METKLKVKRKDGLKRQAQIMEIASELFSVKGYNATSLDDILKAAGIAKGTFYLHFEGKFDLLDKIIDEKLEMFYGYVKVLDISAPGPIDEIRQLYLTVAATITQMEDFKKFSRLLLREYMGVDQSILNKVNAFFETVVSMTEEYLSKAQEEGRVKPELDTEIVAYSVVGAVKELFFRWAIMDQEIDIENTVNNTLDLFLHGMLV
ncbi:MAG: TetR/AcrR family transcriptional regulator [bacterium]|nr:TetR/AcrR family transcriptional regulator [bacterium]